MSQSPLFALDSRQTRQYSHTARWLIEQVFFVSTTTSRQTASNWITGTKANISSYKAAYQSVDGLRLFQSSISIFKRTQLKQSTNPVWSIIQVYERSVSELRTFYLFSVLSKSFTNQYLKRSSNELYSYSWTNHRNGSIIFVRKSGRKRIFEINFIENKELLLNARRRTRQSTSLCILNKNNNKKQEHFYIISFFLPQKIQHGLMLIYHSFFVPQDKKQTSYSYLNYQLP